MREKHSRKIRIKDIAEMAGVSVGTVDRVIHDRGEVKEETRIKVMRIVNQLGYTPNLLAKSLALKKTTRIAILLPGLHDQNPYWEQPLSGIKQASAELHDYNADVKIFTFDATKRSSFVDSYKELLNSEPNGVIFTPIFKKESADFINFCEKIEIPYIFLDVNLSEKNHLAYFGQDATRSGFLAGKLMNYGLENNSKVIVLKLAKNKLITHHLIKREEGFLSFFKEINVKKIETVSLEIDLSIENEPNRTLSKVFSEIPNIRGVFVTNSRVHKAASFISKNNIKDVLLVGYDLIEQNRNFLEEEIIDFLICQKPEEQGYKSVMSLFNFILSHKPIKKINYSSIDIIVKENIEFYKNFKY